MEIFGVVHLSSGLGRNPVEGFCKHCNEPSNSIKGGESSD
jgi:hypothetical protein